MWIENIRLATPQDIVSLWEYELRKTLSENLQICLNTNST